MVLDAARRVRVTALDVLGWDTLPRYARSCRSNGTAGVDLSGSSLDRYRAVDDVLPGTVLLPASVPHIVPERRLTTGTLVASRVLTVAAIASTTAVATCRPVVSHCRS